MWMIKFFTDINWSERRDENWEEMFILILLFVNLMEIYPRGSIRISM